MTHKTTSAVIFARVSSTTDRQDTTRQVNDLTDYANAMGIGIAKVFEEKCSGGKLNKERLILTDCLTYCKDNAVKTILVSEMSRIGRNTWEVLESVKLCNDNGINLYFQKEQLNTLNADGTTSAITAVIVSCLSMSAEMERENIKFRLQSGYKQYRSNGGAVGRKVGSTSFEKGWQEKYAEHIKYIKKGYAVRTIAKICDCSPTTISKLKKYLAEK